jgi:ADP-ribose pyrophosphatase YjhB (NUDIX family)
VRSIQEKSITKRYSGVVLKSNQNQFILQKRENKKNISNPGLITTFGGVCKHNESHIECAVREIKEELCYILNSKKLILFLNLIKKEMNGLHTYCEFFYYKKSISLTELNLIEGEEIICFDKSVFIDFEKSLSPTCEKVLTTYMNIGI